ncbi:MAG TPA: histidine kinase [Solirubrobacteraceae bacterium]|nr:histidine kinase [Solirubrobacteraceae bacterium]
MSALWRRARMTSPLLRDRIFAGLLFVMAEIEVLVVGGDAPLPLLMLAAAGYSLPLAWRRVRPPLMVAVVVASVVAMSALLTDATQYFVPFLGVMLFSYSAGAYADGRTAYAGLAIMVAGVLTVTLLSPTQIAGDYIFPTSFAVVAWLSGRAVRTRTRLTEELHEAAVREQETREMDAQRAAADERRRIAREMHDVVAHSVSVMVVQAGGARRILARDPERAVAAAEQIERTGREALAEMRRLLGVLHREDDAHDARAPQPTMAGIDALVARARGAGLPVELHVEGARRSLPAGLDLAAFRVVQEGLTNALKYADHAPTEVHVRWGERTLELEILDRGPGPARDRLGGDGGHGLVGMRERVKLYGGELEAGRRRGGGFRIHAKLPLVADQANVEAAA